MNYLKGLITLFLVVFFADHILPGIEVTNHTKLPHVGDDLIFAGSIAFLNSLIYPFFRLTKRESSGLKIAAVAVILNFASYAIVKLLPIGVSVLTIEGYISASVVVTVGSFLINFFEMKRRKMSNTDLNL
jgi:hypothetical protein